jgi:hypothetical protein
VQNNAGQQQIQVDVFVMRGGRPRQLAHRQHMLDQSANVGMMNGLRCRSRAVSLGDFPIGEECREKRLEVGIREPGDNTVQLGEHLLRVAFRRRQKIPDFNFVIGDALQPVNRELRLVLKNLNLPAHANKIVAVERIGDGCGVVPHFGFQVAGLVGKRQDQVGFAGTLLTNFFIFDEEHRRHVRIRRELVNVG